MKTKIRLLLFLLTASSSLMAQSQFERSLVLGVHPYLSFEELQKRFTPLVEYLSKEINQEIVIRIGLDYSEHLKTIGNDEVDIAYLGPAEYVEIVQQYGPKPLLGAIVTSGTACFQGHIIVRTDSPVMELSELGPHDFAFVDPHSTMGYLIPLWMLSQTQSWQGHGFKPYFLGSHNNVALGVLMGDYPAGAVKEEIFYSYQNQGLRSVAVTPDIPEHCFVARSDMPATMIKQLQQALFLLPEDKDGMVILRSIKNNVTGIAAVQSQNYDELRDILSQLERVQK